MLTRRQVLQASAGAVALGVWRAPLAEAWCATAVEDVALGDAAWATLPVRRARGPFHLIGVCWRQADGLHVEVRARRRGGEWTPWTSLPSHSEHAPDDARPGRATEPCWTGAADYFQIRVRGRASRLSARLVTCAPVARASARPKAQSPPGGPPIIMRPAWGGDSCAPRSPAEYGEVQVAFVHHTVTANEYTPEQSASIVLGICRYHRDTNGWNDLGYNFLVDRHGQIFEGRAGGIDQAVIGAQAQGYNSVSTGIACIGDFSAMPNSEPGIDALARLVAWKLAVHGVPVTGQVTVTSAGGSTNRYPSGTPVTFERISGHRDGDRTACPGDALYAQLPDLRARASSYAVPVSTLTVRAERTVVRHPSAVALSGVLRFADGSSPAGAVVEVQRETSPGSWETATRTTADGVGSWHATVDPAAGGLVRAYFPGDASRPPLAAAPVSIRVLPRLTLGFSQRRPRVGTRVEVTGTLGPTWPARIELVLERAIGRRWVVEQRKKINVRGGRFKTLIRPRRAGLYRVSVLAPDVTVRRRLRSVELTGGAAAAP